MKRLAVLGANGLLGGDLARYLSSSYEVIPVTRENYEEHRGEKFNVLINANGNSKRFWALQNIYQDFEASTVSVYKTIFDFRFDKYIHNSSVDVYPDPSSPQKTQEDQKINIADQNPYGFHKYLSEQIVKKHLSDWLILRLSMILGTTLKKGPIFDILNDSSVFVTSDSKLQLITTQAIAGIIKAILEDGIKNETFNVGGEGVFDLSGVNKHFGRKEVQFSPEAGTQTYEMNIGKIKRVYPSLKTSEAYLQDFIKEYNNTHGQGQKRLRVGR